MDRAILACYGWHDLNPNHGFYQNGRGQRRYTIAPEARIEILRRLLTLNLEIAAKEAADKLAISDSNVMQWQGDNKKRGTP